MAVVSISGDLSPGLGANRLPVWAESRSSPFAFLENQHLCHHQCELRKDHWFSDYRKVRVHRSGGR